ncbi:hypothetical protein ACTXJ8_13505 [Corynebacterium variabile]|uniref:hypothetical protein n=1 Tax=Corynebacterium variabile TaxID=1727 RepID=UPI003FD0ECD3
MRTITLTITVDELGDDDTTAFTVADALQDVVDTCHRRGVLPAAGSMIGNHYDGTRRGSVEHVVDPMTAGQLRPVSDYFAPRPSPTTTATGGHTGT